jgi:uncharacterized protein (TIGR02266 family)
MGEPDSPSEERRNAVRATLEVHIDLHTDSQFFAGFSQDLSDGGLFVATYSPAPVGTEIEVAFDLAEHRIRTLGRVVWLREESVDAVPGMGLAFKSLSEADLAAIAAFTRERAPLFYDRDSTVS